MNNYWAFLPMRSSNDLLGDEEALRDRMAEDGYLLFRKVLDEDRLLSLRRDLLGALAEVGWVQASPDPMSGVTIGEACREGEDAFFAGYDLVQRIESFHALAHTPELMAIMRQVVGASAFPHPLKIARLSFPEHYEISTPPHQDYPNNQGTPNLTAAWMPVGDCPKELGGLAVLRGSHRYGVLPLDRSMAAGMRCAVIPEAMLEELRWVTTEYEVGDLLLFPAMTVHAALHNASEFHMRLSVDFRYQQEGEALTPIALEPHFQRLTWDQIYANWRSDELQYYWRDLDYEVEEFRSYELLSTGTPEQDAKDISDYIRRNVARRNRRWRSLDLLPSPPAPPR
jgi:ectoine hydroxylase-related dioxygenase (phytanoyl-CoA dioxygenase family)